MAMCSVKFSGAIYSPGYQVRGDAITKAMPMSPNKFLAINNMTFCIEAPNYLANAISFTRRSTEKEVKPQYPGNPQ